MREVLTGLPRPSRLFRPQKGTEKHREQEEALGIYSKQCRHWESLVESEVLRCETDVRGAP